jgi:hypothetical protein
MHLAHAAIAAAAVVAVLAVLPRATFAQTVRLGPVAGASLLEHRDTSLTHGPLSDEVTVGRTFLVGAALDVQFTGHDHLGIEIVFGPYQNDVERSCVSTSGPACTPVPFFQVSRGLLYGLQYLRSFRERGARVYVAGGVGVKQYWYEEPFVPANVSPTVSGAFGVERPGRHLLRAELRTLVVQDNPLLLGKTQVELQARVSWLFGFR